MDDRKHAGDRKGRSSNRRGGGRAGRGHIDAFESLRNADKRVMEDKHVAQELHQLNASAKDFKPGATVVSTVVKEASFSVSCLICAAENVKYIAVGPCDHPVCSLCTMRLRYKSRDHRCPICTQDMEHVVVHSTALGEKEFASFGIWGDSAAPGMNVDHQTRMIYFKCESHFIDMTSMRSLVCPIPVCRMRFPSEDHLLRHMPEMHSLTFCRLCVAHRPLFLAEHNLWTPAQLSQHVNAPPGALSGKKGDKMGGHPACRFCKDHFFDTQELYKHMRSAHSTCHLCPASFQHRYFKNGRALRDHIRDNHFVCSMCDTEASFEADLEIGFRSTSELSLHMQQVHRIMGAERERNLAVQIGFHGPRRGSGSDHNADPEYVDLDFSSADPNRHRLGQGQGPGHRGSREEGIAETRGVDSRRGGKRGGHSRASGGGAAAGDFAESMDSFPTATGTSTGSGIHHVPHWAGFQSAAVRIEDAERFPTLGGVTARSTVASGELTAQTSSGKAPTSSGVQAAALHPLSLMRQRLSTGKAGTGVGAASENEETSKDAELRRGMRHLALAEALGVDSVRDRSAATVAAGALLAAGGQEPQEGVAQKQHWNLLRRPLYTPALIGWAKKSKLDVTKIEKKMHELVTNKSLSSVQLKPMLPFARGMVHALAKYYCLNSQEFDPDPRRYVSLVKTIDSCVPSQLLSAAAAVPPMPPPPASLRLPIILVSLKDIPRLELASSSSAVAAVGAAAGGGGSSAELRAPSSPPSYTVAEVLGYLRVALESATSAPFYFGRDYFRISGLRPVGPFTIGVEFPDVCMAAEALFVLSAATSVAAKITRSSNAFAYGAVTSSGAVVMPLTDVFTISPAFDPSDESILRLMAERERRENEEYAAAVAVSEADAVEVWTRGIPSRDDDSSSGGLFGMPSRAAPPRPTRLLSKPAEAHYSPVVAAETAVPTVSLAQDLVDSVQQEWEDFLNEEANEYSPGREISQEGDVKSQLKTPELHSGTQADEQTAQEGVKNGVVQQQQQEQDHGPADRYASGLDIQPCGRPMEEEGHITSKNAIEAQEVVVDMLPAVSAEMAEKDAGAGAGAGAGGRGGENCAGAAVERERSIRSHGADEQSLPGTSSEAQASSDLGVEVEAPISRYAAMLASFQQGKGKPIIPLADSPRRDGGSADEVGSHTQEVSTVSGVGGYKKLVLKPRSADLPPPLPPLPPTVKAAAPAPQQSKGQKVSSGVGATRASDAAGQQSVGGATTRQVVVPNAFALLGEDDEEEDDDDEDNKGAQEVGQQRAPHAPSGASSTWLINSEDIAIHESHFQPVVHESAGTQQQVGLDDGSWACAVCTLINAVDPNRHGSSEDWLGPVCDACGTPRSSNDEWIML